MTLRNIALAAGLLVAGLAGAQTWTPQRNVEVIVPATAGGSLDTTGRTITRIWGDLKLLPVSSNISNRAGGGHAVAYNYLAQRAGDPHYLGVTSMTLLANHVNGNIPLTYTDFTPLAVLLTEYIAIAVQADSPLKSGKDLIDALRKAPNSLSLALSSAPGGTHHMSFAMPLLAGVVDVGKTKLVVFNSSAEAVTALLGGHVDVISAGTVQVAPFVASGKLRVLAVSAPRRMTGPLAAAPTWPELGLKGVMENWRGVIGAKNITAEQIRFWDNTFQRITSSEAFRDYAQKNQWEITYRGADESRRFMAEQYDELKPVMTELGLARKP
ncbi:MAG: hypothetical protein JWN94_4881 [Betaproteobacteria bacterium]|nr:hypothetical protein [Betaproteobacteria bacterium]